MKIKLAVLEGAKPVLAKILSYDLPFASARALAQAIKKIDDELTLVNEKRLVLVKKYGKEDEKTKAINVTPENMEAFFKDYNEVLDTEIDLDISPIPSRLLEHPNVLLKTEEYMRLEKLVA